MLKSGEWQQTSLLHKTPRISRHFHPETTTTMNTLKNKFALLATAIALLSVPAVQAQLVTFNVDLNTSSLNSLNGGNAPFYLDFQLNYGGSTNPATTVTLSNFYFYGGSVIGSPTTTGTATGSLTSTTTLTASSASQFNELFQQFAAGTTDIKFTATVSGAGTDSIPTAFTASLFDNSLGSPAPLFTTAPDTASIVVLDINPANTLADVHAYETLSSADGNTEVNGVTPSITAVPEPSTYAAIMGVAVIGWACFRRRFGKIPVAQTA